MDPRQRHQARRFALQALYQWQLTQNDISTIEAYMLQNEHMAKQLNKIDMAYFKQLLHKIPASVAALDAKILPELDREITELNPIELTLLRMGVYEFCEGEVPPKVTINEAVELAKVFGGEDGHKYVNGVLDRILKKM